VILVVTKPLLSSARSSGTVGRDVRAFCLGWCRILLAGELAGIVQAFDARQSIIHLLTGSAATLISP